MKKFSNLKNKTEKQKQDDVLYKDDHVEIIKFKDWSILKQKDAVCCIPYLIETNQIVLRYEYIPTFKYTDGSDHFLTLVCGGIEQGESPEKALIRELEEEAGIVLREDYVIESDITPIYVCKSVSSKYHPYIIPLNERDYHEVLAKGDGTAEEKLSKSVKVDIKFINSLKPSDLITDYMLLKLKEYLNY